MRKIHTQALAKQDLKNIWLYSFKNWGEKQADCYFDELNAAIFLIAENPEMGFVCDYIREGYRQFNINRHFVFYRVTATKIHIVRVLHDSMNFKHIFKNPFLQATLPFQFQENQVLHLQIV